MIVRVFYNSKAFKDIVNVIIHDRDVLTTETKNNVTKLLDVNCDIIGYNICMPNFESQKDGYQPMTTELLKQINEILNVTFNEELIHDFNSYIVVGDVKECVVHPDSDHMHVCQVDVGSKVVQIVCGASNIEQGQKVVVCLEGAVMPDGMLIQKGKLRGVPSDGMIASAYELGLIAEPKKGILVLDSSSEVGKPFIKE